MYSVRWWWTIVAMVVGFLLATILRSCEPPHTTETKTVTEWKERIVERPAVDRDVKRVLALSRPQVPQDAERFGPIDSSHGVTSATRIDSIRIVEGQDTVDVAHSTPQRTFAYTWRRPADTPRIETSFRESSKTVETVPDVRRFGIGPYVGTGYDPFLGTWKATIGACVSWHIIEWE